MVEDAGFKDDLLAPPEGVYVNTAAESPILRCVAARLEAYTRDKAKGEPGRQAFEETIETCRGRVARLLECGTDDVAFCYTASDALGVVTQSLPWKEGDRVVVSDLEYPSDVLVWRNLGQTRVSVDLVTAAHEDWNTDAVLAKITPKTRLVVVSAVSFCTGHRVDLGAIREAVHQHGGWLLVDATQALGAVPVVAADADIIVSSGFKWLMGVHGASLLYVDPSIVDQLQPAYAGARSVVRTTGLRDAPYQNGARKFEAGMPGFPAIYGLEAGIAYLQDHVGVQHVWSRVDALAGLLMQRFDALGLPLLTPRESERRAGIVCFRHERAREVVDSLKTQGVFTHAPVETVVRFSPHFFNTRTDIERCEAVMQSYANL